MSLLLTLLNAARAATSVASKTTSSSTNTSTTSGSGANKTATITGGGGTTTLPSGLDAFKASQTNTGSTSSAPKTTTSTPTGTAVKSAISAVGNTLSNYSNSTSPTQTTQVKTNATYSPTTVYSSPNTPSTGTKPSTSAGVNANNNNPLSQLVQKITNQLPKGTTSKLTPSVQNQPTTDWTKYGWSKDYGNFLNSIQGNTSKLESEKQHTLNKINQSGGGNKDQLAHLQRIEQMLKGTQSQPQSQQVAAQPQQHSNQPVNPVQVGQGSLGQGGSIADLLNRINQNITTKDGRVVNRTTLNTNAQDQYSGFDPNNKPLGWNEKDNKRINFSYVPEGLGLPKDGNFSVASHAITGPDGNALRDAQGNVMWEYRPHVYYDKNGNPSYTSANDITVTKGGRTQINSEAYGLDREYGYDLKEVKGHESQMVEMRHPITGEWQKMNKGSAEAIWRNYTEGGHYSQADKANNIRVVEGEYSKSSDLKNSYVHSENAQAKAEFNNNMWNDNPEQALSFRAQQEDDWLRSEHYKKTGEQLPKDHFLEEVKQRQQVEQQRINSFLEAIRTNPNHLQTQGNAQSNQGQGQVQGQTQGQNQGQGTSQATDGLKIDWNKFGWSKEYGDFLNSIDGNKASIEQEINKTQQKIQSMGNSVTDNQTKHLDRLNHMLNLTKIQEGTYNPAETANKNSQPAQSQTAKSTNPIVSVASNILEKAAQYIGTPYQWGGSNSNGFDCSGFTQYVFKDLGVDIPRTAAQQFKEGTAVSKNDLQKGDLVFFQNTDSRSGITHVGIYQGDGKFIGAQSKGVGTQDLNSSYWQSKYAGAKRVLDSSQAETFTPASYNQTASTTSTYSDPSQAMAKGGSVDWTQFNWSKDYGNFLNSIQGDPSKIQAEIKHTIDKMGSLGSEVGADQYKHLERLYYMQQQNNKPQYSNPIYEDFTTLPPQQQQEITKPTDELVNLLMEQMQNDSRALENLYREYMDMADNIKMPEIAKLTWEQAMSRASSQLDPLYNQKLQATMDAIDQDLIARGFFGQVPGAVVQKSTAAQVETERAGQKAALAQELVNRSFEEAQSIMQSQLQFQQNQLQNFMQGINMYSAQSSSRKGDLMSLLQYHQGERQYEDQRADTNWEKWFKTIQFEEQLKNSDFSKNMAEKEFTLNTQKFLAEATGYINGEPTLATQRAMQQVGMDNAKLQLEIQKAEDAIRRGWAQIEISASNAATSQQNANTNAQNSELNYSKYYTDVMDKSTKYAITMFANNGGPDLYDQRERDALYQKYFQEGYRMYSGNATEAELNRIFKETGIRITPPTYDMYY